MTQVIVRQGRGYYVGAMRQALARLLLIAAMLLMPLGMAAPAAAVSHHAPAASSAMSHCPDQGSPDQRQSGLGECTMACASALPAIAPTGEHSLAPVVAPNLRLLSEPLAGLHPETATPPPRLA